MNKITIRYDKYIELNGRGISSVEIDGEIFEDGILELVETIEEEIPEIQENEISLYFEDSDIRIDYNQETTNDKIIDLVNDKLWNRFEFTFERR